MLLSVIGRDVLPVSARKELGVDGGICYLQPGSQTNFFTAAFLYEKSTDSSTAAKSMKSHNMSTAEQMLLYLVEHGYIMGRSP